MELKKIKDILKESKGAPTPKVDMHFSEILLEIIDRIEEGGGDSDLNIGFTVDEFCGAIGDNAGVTLSKADLADIFGITEKDIDSLFAGKASRIVLEDGTISVLNSFLAKEDDNADDDDSNDIDNSIEKGGSEKSGGNTKAAGGGSIITDRIKGGVALCVGYVNTDDNEYSDSNLIIEYHWTSGNPSYYYKIQL